jgi:hypothetical protein
MENPISLIEAHQKRVDEKNGVLELGPDGTSLTLLQAIYKNSLIPLHTRMRAAAMAIAYEHPKLAVTAVVTEQDFASLLDARIANMERISNGNGKVIEAKPTDGEKANARMAPPIPDRRSRRI